MTLSRPTRLSNLPYANVVQKGSDDDRRLRYIGIARPGMVQKIFPGYLCVRSMSGRFNVKWRSKIIRLNSRITDL